MKFDCSKCGQEVVISDAEEDRILHESRAWRCPLCYTVIADNLTKEKPGTVTLFSPADGLGDKIVQECVFDYYRRSYPLESCQQLTYADIGDNGDFVVSCCKLYNVGKVFWSSSTCRVKAPKLSQLINFDVAREATVLEDKGIYPSISTSLESERINQSNLNMLGTRYIALSARNVNKVAFKNIEPHFLNRLYLFFDALVQNNIIDQVVIIGNDDRFDDVWDPPYVLDMRKKLSLTEIAIVLNHSLLTVGKDNGLLHLAAAAGSNVVGWGYEQLMWKPKAPPGKVQILMKQDSNPIAIAKKIACAMRALITSGSFEDMAWNRMSLSHTAPETNALAY